MKKFLIIQLLFLPLFLFLTNCASKPESTVAPVIVSSYPELPNIEPLPPLDLQPWKHDVPRDKSGKPLSDSNIFLGFDQQNYTILLDDLAKVRERIFQLQARIDEVNKERKEWRDKAQAERQKITQKQQEEDQKNKK